MKPWPTRTEGGATATVADTPPKVKALCRCCGRRKVNRPRGLCWSCYYNPDNRGLFPSTSKSCPGKRGGETMEELDALIKERYATMPPKERGEDEPREPYRRPVFHRGRRRFELQ